MKKVFDLCDALTSLCPNASFTIKNGIVQWVNTPTYIPTETEIQAKIAELEAEEPMRLLRLERNRKLADVDWITLKAYSQKQDVAEDWTNYMQALRDLPKMIEPDDSTEPLPAPTINEQGQLTFLHWPEIPE